MTLVLRKHMPNPMPGRIVAVLRWRVPKLQKHGARTSIIQQKKLRQWRT
ncbi:hypothetical protein [Alkanindiges illinoisensis]|nr:hypothetical protein [Alkanindiges illinoisensis]